MDDRDNVIHVTFLRDGTARRDHETDSGATRGDQEPGGSEGSGQAGSGQAGSGQAGSGQAGSGQAGSGQTGLERAGSDQGVLGAPGRGFRPDSGPAPAVFDGDGTSHDPLANLYSLAEAARVFGFRESRLRYWSRSGFLVPSGRVGKRRFYTFQDLIGLRVAKALLDDGVPIQRVRRSLESLQGSLPKVVRPLAELRIVADGQNVLVKAEEGAYEPTTGQLVLDFDVSQLRDDVVRVLRPRGVDTESRRRAYDLYLEGCRLDEDEETAGDAEDCYRRALQLDPSLANALTNLGNIRFRQGDTLEAETLYRQALEVDERQPEAHYNLGFLAYERGQPCDAVPYFRKAIDEDPSFADAHFNLAMALEELGLPEQARPHWTTYLRLDPAGPWAEVARRYLGQ